MYHTILACTDGSANAEEAVRAAGRIAGFGDETVLHVVTVAAPTSDEYSEVAAHLPPDLRERLDPNAAGASRLAAAQAIVDDQGVKFVGHAVEGDPAEAILDLAKEQSVDLIVIGSRGVRTAGRFPRGSVSTKVGQFAPCNVLVIQT